MGIRASSTTTVLLDDVRVPAANVLGEVGQGLQGGDEASSTPAAPAWAAAAWAG